MKPHYYLLSGVSEVDFIKGLCYKKGRKKQIFNKSLTEPNLPVFYSLPCTPETTKLIDNKYFFCQMNKDRQYHPVGKQGVFSDAGVFEVVDYSFSRSRKKNSAPLIIVVHPRQFKVRDVDYHITEISNPVYYADSEIFPAIVRIWKVFQVQKESEGLVKLVDYNLEQLF